MRVLLKAGFPVGVLVLTMLCARAFGAEKTVLAVTGRELREGVAVAVDGRPWYIRVEEPPSRHFTMRPGESAPEIHVSVIEETPGEPETFFIPVEIEDKVLALGVALKLTAPDGTDAEVRIPPRRVFLSIPFNIPISPEAHPGFAGRNAIIQVIPRITKKAQVEINNTATDGVVADIKYEGVADLKFKDLLNRTNRRDMDGILFIGREKGNRWTIDIQNLFEKFDERDLAIMRDRPFPRPFRSRFRLDNLQNYHNISFGANVVYSSRLASVEIGNVDRLVKPRTHTTLRYGGGNASALVRFEGVEAKNPSGRLPLAFHADRFGWQAALYAEKRNSAFSAVIGNLKVEDYTDRGEIDDYTNFIFSASRSFGETLRPYHGKRFLFSGDYAVEYYGRGSRTWVKGEVNFNVSYRRNYLMYVRLNDDFARVTGGERAALWENFFVSIMRNRDYFNPRDPLNRWDVESVYLDFNWERQGKGQSYVMDKRIGLSRLILVWKYDVPMELYLETDKTGKFRPGIGVSIRRYL
ncbi:MAG: hypothetical protein AB1742_12545 [bacterium]